MYLRLVNSRDTTSQDALNPQPLQHYLYKYPSMVRPYSEEFRSTIFVWREYNSCLASEKSVIGAENVRNDDVALQRFVERF